MVVVFLFPMERFREFEILGCRAELYLLALFLLFFPLVVYSLFCFLIQVVYAPFLIVFLSLFLSFIFGLCTIQVINGVLFGFLFGATYCYLRFVRYSVAFSICSSLYLLSNQCLSYFDYFIVDMLGKLRFIPWSTFFFGSFPIRCICFVLFVIWCLLFNLTCLYIPFV